MYIFSLEKKTDFENRWTYKEILFWKKTLQAYIQQPPTAPPPGYWEQDSWFLIQNFNTQLDLFVYEQIWRESTLKNIYLV